MTADGRHARWEQHREAQHRRIVDAAIEIIEDGDTSPSLAEVGRRAGLARSVVYRHFSDKASLDKAVADHIIGEVRQEISAALQLRSSLRETIRDAFAAYVAWATLHPALHALQDDAAAADLVRGALDGLAAQVADLYVAGFTAAGADVTEADRLTTTPLAHGLVSGVFAMVGKWVRQGAKVPSPDNLVAITVELVVAMTTTRLAAYGVTLDPDAPLFDLSAD
ncbi:TetR/AcrR family transcriptional regulator [Nocardioides caeni]|uniref:TetR/AcrR family transcriptional regulator n=1 Tax=Nocardioides caeni TaxID=574700 RepID=UPI0013051995|nr:TetR/AcrR family transcriptional regulator [Nocardioides caeni]